jgi:outer membrane protein assembly factor BamE (lipoprotein component of BamABCDE complex)
MSIKMDLLRAFCHFSLSFFLGMSFHNCCGLKVLLIGDSVDQSIVNNLPGCNKTTWAKKYPHSLQNMCLHNFSSIASLKVFGSKPYGPYSRWLNLEHKNSKDGFYNTKDRIQHGLKIYFEDIGVPDRIVFNTILWDARPFYFSENMNTTNLRWNSTLQEFRNNVNGRITDILEIVASYGVSTEICLRTAPRYDVVGGSEDFPVGDLVGAYNEIVRDISKVRSISIYDFDKDLWSVVNYNKSEHWQMFRDDCHPKDHIVRDVALKLICKRYSSFYTWRGNKTSADCILSRVAYVDQQQYKVYLNSNLLSTKIAIKKDLLSNLTTLNQSKKINITCFISNINFDIKLVYEIPSRNSSKLQYPFKLKYISSLKRFTNGSLYRYSRITESLLRNYSYGIGDVFFASKRDLTSIPFFC